MEQNWIVYVHRHQNGAMFPVQARVIAEFKNNLDSLITNGAEELHCIQCKVSVNASNPTEDFVRVEPSTRRYHRYSEGTVTRIISKTNEMWYGWVKTNDGKELYFAGSYGRKFVRRPSKLPIMATWTQQKNMRKIEIPKFGTRILLEVKSQDNEVKIYGWGYADEYDNLVGELNADTDSKDLFLPLEYVNGHSVGTYISSGVMYRIMEQMFYHDRNVFDVPLVIWAGTDLSEINRACPLSHLIGAKNSCYDRITWFEKFENEQWITCDDPRYASGSKHLNLPL